MRHHQATDHLRGAQLPRNTPAKNPYVVGVYQHHHTSLGTIYIHPLAMQKTKAKRGRKRKMISAEDAERDPQLITIRAAAQKMDTLGKFNSSNGPPKLDKDQKCTSHQLLGYAIRRVANNLHVYLRRPIPPTSSLKCMQWNILRAMTTWRAHSKVSPYATLTSIKEKRRGLLVKLDDEVTFFFF